MELLVDLGLKWVILGHSERRTLLKETSEVGLSCSLNVGYACRPLTTLHFYLRPPEHDKPGDKSQHALSC